MTGMSSDVLEDDAHVVAPRLLGAHLASNVGGKVVVVRIVEVEAYDQDDPASHTFSGQTSRNRVMWGPAGHAYVYRSHGVHACMNIVCGPQGRGAAVLVRGGQVLEGRTTASTRRAGRDDDAWLAAGPGRLCQALGVGLEHDGLWLLGREVVQLRLDASGVHSDVAVAQGPRVGVTRAAEVPWRWWIEGAPGVSRYRRSPRAPRPQRQS